MYSIFIFNENVVDVPFGVFLGYIGTSTSGLALSVANVAFCDTFLKYATELTHLRHSINLLDF